jgi:transposase
LKKGKLKFVFTPKHASWLNIIESFFSKMSRGFLKAIRVESVEELKNRINQYINLLNEKPVVFLWKYKIEGEDRIPGGISI